MPHTPRNRSANLNLEALDERAVPAVDVAVLSARLDAPTQVRFTYQATGNPGSFDVEVYRSADDVFDTADGPPIETATITPPSGTRVRTGTVRLDAELPTDLERKHVLVVARAAGDTNPANDAAGFKKWAVAAVTHGFTLTGAPPAWLVPMTEALEAKGYDLAVPYVWTPLSQLPVPGGTVIAGAGMAGTVRAAAADLAGPNDAVDVHLIGHSRGTGVVSQAFRSLEVFPGSRAVRVGYYTQTLLDPHVADNVGGTAAALAQFAANTGDVPAALLSYDETRLTSRAFAAGTIAFQAAANDPAAFAPLSVDRLKVIYQQLAWDETAPGSVERLVGVNFLAPDPATIDRHAGTEFEAIDVGTFGVGHYEVPLWYLATLTAP